MTPPDPLPVDPVEDISPPAESPAPPKPLETSLATLAGAANEAAKREAAQWFYFVTIMLTLTAIVGSTTHRVLFLEQAIKVPFLSLELPLLGFYWTAPTILVVLHFYVLAQLKMLADKLRVFLDAVEREAQGDQAARDLALTQLDSFSVVQLLVSERFGVRQVQVRLMVWVTLVVAPVLLLLFFQLRFLPYHDPYITGWHRLLIGLDLFLIWWLWPTFVGRLPWRFWYLAAVRWGSVAAVLLFSWGLATIPGEWLEIGRPLAPLRGRLFDGEVNPVTQRETSPFSRRLVLPDEEFLTEAQKKAWIDVPEAARGDLPRTLVLRGRDLRLAVLDRADLRKADLTGASLIGASLARVKLEYAVLNSTQMQNVRLDYAQMQGASLDRAQMQGARLDGARMQGASLDRVQMQGAKLDGAQVQGAFFNAAEMQNTSLLRAQMQGVLLYSVQMQGAQLIGTQLQGAQFIGAQMQGAWFHEAQMQGALIEESHLQGTSFSYVGTWGLSARGVNMEDTLVIEPNFRDIPSCTQGPTASSPCEREQSWSHWVALWSTMVPDGQARIKVAQRLAALNAPASSLAAELRRSWDSRPVPNLERMAQRLGDLACDESHAPHLARGILRQIQAGRSLGPHVQTFADRLNDPTKCPGAQGLTNDERALIAVTARDRKA